MSENGYVHALSPEALILINRQITELLRKDDFEVTSLLKLVEERHNIVTKHMAELDETEVRTFAEAEWAVQEDLQNEISELFKQSRHDITKYLKAKKAVANYK